MAVTAAFLAFLLPNVARAATLFVSPGTRTLRTDEVFTATIRVNTQGTSINAAEGVLKFDPVHLRVESVTAGSSIFSVSVQGPEFSNTASTVNYAGIILNPGYTGSSGTLLTVRFRARAVGTTAVDFVSGAVLANDGQGTNVLGSISGAVYRIVGTEPTPLPTSEPVNISPGTLVEGSIVISPTHPDPDRWYTNNDPRFTWILPSDVTGVSWLIADNPTGNPGSILDGLVDGVAFENVSEGINYFHIKFQRGDSFGPITHYGFRVDTVPPLPFTLSRITEGDKTDPQPQLVYATSDATSGIQQYRMLIGDGEWFDVAEAPEERPFRMPLLKPGVHPVTVESVDGAGLTTRAETVVTVESIQVPVISVYPDRAASNEQFSVSGTAGAGSEVTVRVRRVGPVAGFPQIDSPVATVHAFTDESGVWRTVIDALPVGEYELNAAAADSRGAISHSSRAVTVLVGHWLIRLITSLPYWFLALALWGKALTVLGLAGLLWFLVRLFRRGGSGRIGHVNAKSRSVLEELLYDIEAELAMLARLSKGRPLYPEEKHLKTKLSDYHKKLEKLVGSKQARRAHGRKKTTKRRRS